MPNVKISELPELTTPADSDLLEIVNAGQSKKITRGNLLAALKFISVTKNINLDVIADNITAEINRTKGISWTDADPASSDDNLKTAHIGISSPIRMEGNQVVPNDPVKAKLSKELMTIGSVFTIMDDLRKITMMAKGTITSFADIVESGVYEGVDIPNSPAQGKVMVMAAKDSVGDFGYFLLGVDMIFHVGRKGSTYTTIKWNSVQHISTSEGTVEISSPSAGYAGVMIDTISDPTKVLDDGLEHAVTFVDSSTIDWATVINPDLWYFAPATQSTGGHAASSETGQVHSATGNISKAIAQGWVANQNIVTIKYNIDPTIKKFEVIKVEGGNATAHSAAILADGSVEMDSSYVPAGPNSIVTKKMLLPTAPTADGNYKLNIAGGVATWIAI